MKIDFTRVMSIDFLIRHKSTGNPESLASHLGISKRTLFETLNFMKDSLHAPIIYDRKKKDIDKAIAKAIKGLLMVFLLSNLELTELLMLLGL
eukprot:gene10062-11737_t